MNTLKNSLIFHSQQNYKKMSPKKRSKPEFNTSPNPKKQKFHPFSAANKTINQVLPVEVLYRILEKSFSKSLLLVCKYWNQLLTNHHVFEKLTFLEKRRSAKDYNIFINSKRKYKSVNVMLKREDSLSTIRLENLLKRNKTIKKININVKLPENLTHTYFTNIIIAIIRSAKPSNLKVTYSTRWGSITSYFGDLRRDAVLEDNEEEDDNEINSRFPFKDANLTLEIC